MAVESTSRPTNISNGGAARLASVSLTMIGTFIVLGKNMSGPRGSRLDAPNDKFTATIGLIAIRLSYVDEECLFERKWLTRAKSI